MRGTKTFKFHDFWMCGPLGTLIYGFKHTKYFKNKQKSGNVFETSYFYESQHLEIGKAHFCQFGKRRAPKNDENPLNKIPGILDMKSISIEKHDMEIW